MKKLLLFPLCYFLILSTLALALPDRYIPFQGRLTDGDGQVLNGVYTLIFNIYDEPTGSTTMWTEEHQGVSVINGMVSVILGTKMLFNDPEKDGDENKFIKFVEKSYLGITVGANASQEMVPRHQLVPSFKAVMADRAYLADRATDADNADNATLFAGQDAAYYAKQSTVNDLSTDVQDNLINTESLINLLIPAGTVFPFAGTNVPDGYFLCDGEKYKIESGSGSPTPEEQTEIDKHQRLFDIIGFTYGKYIESGDGDTYFLVPNYAGKFLRGWGTDVINVDPDKATRTGFDTNGDAQIGNFVGTNQEDIFASHTHTESYVPNNSKGVSTGSYGEVAYLATKATGATGGQETRPKNVSVMYIIKY